MGGKEVELRDGRMAGVAGVGDDGTRLLSEWALSHCSPCVGNACDFKFV